MTRIWMLCLLTALLHSAAYAAKPNAENPAKGKPAVEVPTSNKTDIVRKAPDDDEEKAPPKSKKKNEPNQDSVMARMRIQPLERKKGATAYPKAAKARHITVFK